MNTLNIFLRLSSGLQALHKELRDAGASEAADHVHNAGRELAAALCSYLRGQRQAVAS